MEYLNYMFLFEFAIVFFLFFSTIFFWIRVKNEKYSLYTEDYTNETLVQSQITDPDKPVYTLQKFNEAPDAYVSLDILPVDQEDNSIYSVYI